MPPTPERSGKLAAMRRQFELGFRCCVCGGAFHGRQRTVIAPFMDLCQFCYNAGSAGALCSWIRKGNEKRHDRNAA